MPRPTQSIRPSKRIIQELDKPEAKKRVSRYANISRNIYRRLCETPLFDTLKPFCRLDLHILIAAIQSAHIDLKKYELFHEASGGHSSSRIAGAVASWINRFCPIQFLSDSRNPQYIWVNSEYAFQVAWELKFRYDNQGHMKKHNLSSEEWIKLKRKRTNSQIKEAIIYGLTWRNPGFKELTTLFDCIPSGITDADIDELREVVP